MRHQRKTYSEFVGSRIGFLCPRAHLQRSQTDGDMQLEKEKKIFGKKR
jgi:hypothetical protein